MWMEECIYSVKDNSQPGNIWVMTTQNSQSRKILSLRPQKFTHFAGKCGRVSQVQEKALVGLCIYLGEYTQIATFEINLTS